MLENAKLAQTHLLYLSKPETRIRENESSLKSMYSNCVIYKTVDDLSDDYLQDHV